MKYLLFLEVILIGTCCNYNASDEMHPSDTFCEDGALKISVVNGLECSYDFARDEEGNVVRCDK